MDGANFRHAVFDVQIRALAPAVADQDIARARHRFQRPECRRPFRPDRPGHDHATRDIQAGQGAPGFADPDIACVFGRGDLPDAAEPVDQDGAQRQGARLAVQKLAGAQAVAQAHGPSQRRCPRRPATRHGVQRQQHVDALVALAHGDRDRRGAGQGDTAITVGPGMFAAKTVVSGIDLVNRGFGRVTELAIGGSTTTSVSFSTMPSCARAARRLPSSQPDTGRHRLSRCHDASQDPFVAGPQ